MCFNYEHIRQTYSNKNEMNATNVAVSDDMQSCDRKSGAELNVATEPSQFPQANKKLNQERLVSDNSKDGSVETTEVTVGPSEILTVLLSESNLMQVHARGRHPC